MVQSFAFKISPPLGGIFGVNKAGIHELAQVTSVQKALYSLAYHKE
jgi:hypothetical protein